MKKMILPLLLTLFTFQFLAAQNVQQEKLLVSIQNIDIENDYVEFDIFLRSGNPNGEAIYLGHTDIVLEMDQKSYENPRLEKIGNSASGGTCTLMPGHATELNKLFTRNMYFNAISCQMKSGQGLVNLAAPAPTSEAGLKTRIAKIDGTVGAHKLARFRMFGFQGGALHGLSIRIPGIKMTKQEAVRKWNYKTKSHTLATTGRFRSTAVAIGLDDQIFTHSFDSVLDTEVESIDIRSGGEVVIEMYPNPVTDKLHVKIKGGEADQMPDRLMVFDLAGKLVHNVELESNKYLINVQKENISSGTYIVQLMKADEIIWQDKAEVLR